MKNPHVRHVLKDSENDVTFVVVAFRQLSDSEVLAAVRYWAARNNKPKRGTEITIMNVAR